ncbi:uncharacterized protein LOC135824446 [Sycon ciliatum]|uniref:uncharacterized protein LOC135824446 n=1 Tax=Sycon ciliatum TaxID=27933 RepID=UPI0031F608CE
MSGNAEAAASGAAAAEVSPADFEKTVYSKSKLVKLVNAASKRKLAEGGDLWQRAFCMPLFRAIQKNYSTFPGPPLNVFLRPLFPSNISKNQGQVVQSDIASENQDQVQSDIASENQDQVQSDTTSENQDQVQSDTTSENQDQVQSDTTSENQDQVQSDTTSENQDQVQSDTTSENQNQVQSDIASENQDQVQSDTTSENQDQVQSDTTSGNQPHRNREKQGQVSPALALWRLVTYHIKNPTKKKQGNSKRQPNNPTKKRERLVLKNGCDGCVYNFTSREFWKKPQLLNNPKVKHLIEPVKVGFATVRSGETEKPEDVGKRRLGEQEKLWIESKVTGTPVQTKKCIRAESLTHRLLNMQEYLTTELRRLKCKKGGTRCTVCNNLETKGADNDDETYGHHEWFTLSTNTTCCKDLKEAVENAVTPLLAQDSSPPGSKANAVRTAQQVKKVLTSLLEDERISSLYLKKAIGDVGELSQTIADDLRQTIDQVETIDQLVDLLLHHILRAYITQVTRWACMVVDAWVGDETPPTDAVEASVEDTTATAAVEKILQPCMMCMYMYLEENLSQDRIDGRLYSQACTVISCLVVYRWLSTRQSTGRSISESQCQDFVRDIRDGNSAYDEAKPDDKHLAAYDACHILQTKRNISMSIRKRLPFKKESELAEALQACAKEAGRDRSILGVVLVNPPFSISLIFLPSDDGVHVRLYDSHSHRPRGPLIALLASDWNESARVISLLVDKIRDGHLCLLRIN